MVFNSVPFFVFFFVFYFLYWFVANKSLRFQNLLLLAGSYVFYGWWNWQLLPLLIGYTAINYLLGHYIYNAKTQSKKSLLTLTGVVLGLGLLIYFKYTNFFIASFVNLLKHFGANINFETLNIILPLGISFYTFRTLSYVIDIKNNKIKPTSDWVAFFSFVAFFPCLLSGPIDKAKTLIPQIEEPRKFDYSKAVDALRQILWGLFKKIVIADSLAEVTNNVFANYQSFRGSTLVIGAIYFSIQLYTDFSGYSDMAIGFAKLLGFDITKNFNFPFFAQNVAEFWRKWHMSLTSWLTDYVFTPLSILFRDYGKVGLIMAIITNLTLIGIWHGANWTFAVYGLLHGLFFIPLIINGTINKKSKTDPNKNLPTLKETYNMLKTFSMVTFSFIIFKADNLTSAFGYIKGICSKSLFMSPVDSKPYYIPIIIIFLIIEWLQRNKEHTLQIGGIKKTYLRWAIYILLFVMILGSYAPDGLKNSAFIYVKF